jgi:hypothetical protein
MADTTSTLSNLLVNGKVSVAYTLTLADRLSFLQHPVVTASYIGDLAGGASTTAKKQVYGFGANLATSETEGTGAGGAASATTLTDSSVSATVGGYSLRRDMSSLVTSIVGSDKIGAAALIGEDLAVAAQMAMVSSFATSASTLTNSVGGTGTDLTLATVLSGLSTFRQNNCRGPILGLLHSIQWSDLATNIATSGSGSIQFGDAGANLATYQGGSFQGSFLGVDWYISNQVPLSGDTADRLGAIIGPDAVVWATSSPAVDNPAIQTVVGAGGMAMLVDVNRDSGAGNSEVVGRVFFGTAKGLENGVLITSGAS